VPLKSLDEDHRKQAVLTYQVADLVLGHWQDGKNIGSDRLRCFGEQGLLLNWIAD
jgi:hypothetical protein